MPAALRDLEIRHLTALREVARARNFGRAADRLGFSQSAVSQQIAALERVVGAPVFERPGGPRPVDPTPLGRILLAHAEAVLDRISAAGDDVEAFLAGQAGVLAIGSFESVSVRVLPQVLSRFRALSPHVDLRLSEHDDQEVLEAQLRGGVIDAAFLIEPIDAAGLRVTRLREDAFVLLSPPNEVENPDMAVDVARLNGVPLISQTDNACQRLIDGALRRVGVDVNVVFRTNDNSAVQAMVRAGVGHAVMPALAVASDDPGVVVRTLSPGIPARTIVVATSAERTPSPAALAFLDITARVCAELPVTGRG